ncbi:hypothetical protein GCM10007863_00870 [Dyella mobilis]|nr:hypothetical protein GCM10007863_00870 [Dyella mobilis]
MDNGESPRNYDHEYWDEEIKSARQRSVRDGLVRAGEVVLYARREVHRFLDVGAGPGFLLDSLANTFPGHSDTFHAVELFPPHEHSKHPNYVVGDAGTLPGKFDAGVCIEVIEHLTPRMLQGLIKSLAAISAPDSTWLFNTGMPSYVRHEDPGYLDPRGRGHVVSYGLKGLRKMFSESNFEVIALPGKSFAFLAEYSPSTSPETFTADRFYKPLPYNKALLEESGLLYIAAFESARSYYFQDESAQRAKWALSLDFLLKRHVTP